MLLLPAPCALLAVHVDAADGLDAQSRARLVCKTQILSQRVGLAALAGGSGFLDDELGLFLGNDAAHSGRSHYERADGVRDVSSIVPLPDH